ncbi:MAG: DNA segregation ATPase FtsK/SpoIIIE, S-DNA-T family [Microgenomates group bacterium Gr01-1014_16]|nr:MAG: DNA segregation ATPase FtsK/SpoIIIE, S-DNA-T family [Microgenomates group bacterium Gr01-1014_16]
MPRSRSLLGRKKFHFRLKQSTIYSATAIALFALSVLIWLSFTKGSTPLAKLNLLLVSNFGVFTALFLPFPFIIGGLMLTKIKSNLAEANALVGSLIILVSFAGLIHTGYLGQLLWLNSSALLSPAGTFLFLLAGLGIGFIVMLNLPFEEVLNGIIQIFRMLAAIPAKFKPAERPIEKVLKMGGMVTPPPSALRVEPAKQLKLPTTNNPQPTTAPLRGATDQPWHYPPLALLSENISGKADRGDVKTNAAVIEKTLEAFGITAKVVEVNLGPAVTQYALEVAIGTKLSKISALGSDLALALAAPTGQIRIEAPIPGRSLVGIELPNRAPEFVSLRKVLESDNMKHHKSKLAVALGLDVSGTAVVTDLARMPHVLIAGSTGSGKSVCINAFIASLLFRTSPQELNLIMVDPKRVELTGYNGIPHLLTPVIVEPDKVLSALKWAMAEMDRRYKQFAEVGVRNLEAFNDMSGFQALPYIVIFVDELADIMLFAPVEVEDAITRIAQMARATGIHLVISTQRPSVDVITGLIKANIPSRIAFAVSSMIDSRVIIDGPGAEKLLGRGDMLYVPPDQAKPSRIQGAFVSDKEIHSLIDFLKKQGVAPHYTDEITSMPIGGRKSSGRGSTFIAPNGEDRDPLFEDAFRIIVQNQNASASFLQRKLSIGYARAARVLDELQQAGIIGPVDGAKPRDILVTDVNSFLSSQPSG